MKTDRLIGILSILLQKEKCTAPELAEKFEVSRRTINRDIDTLCKAGIPVSTVQGAGGGIRIMEGYRIDRTLLTSRDMQMILAGLRSLDSVSGSSYYAQLMEKLQAGASDFVSGRDSMLIDLSSWYKESLAPKISLIQDAIEERRQIAFHYFAPGGESVRMAEPYYLIFKWSSWYVWGWCRKREDFRMFKLNRMEELKKTEEKFVPKQVPMPDLSNERIFPANIRVKVLFEPDAKWRLVEEFGRDYGMYFSILSLIAQGHNTRGEIEGILRCEIGGYLSKLIGDYELVAKRQPLFEKSANKNVHYAICDKFLNFWFRYIYKYNYMLEVGGNDKLRELAGKNYFTYSGKVLEDWFRDKMVETGAYTRMGYWHDRRGENEIDIIAIDDLERRAAFFEVKRQSRDIDLSVLKAKADVFLKSTGLKGYDITYNGLCMEDM